MIYLSSKGDQVDVSKMNSFHLKGAYDKIQRISNHIGGYVGADSEDLVRCVEIVRLNLWKEIERRQTNDPD